MRSVHEGCCGLDVRKKTVVAWVITPEVQEGRSFSTMTKDLLALADWLAGHRVTQVAMESAGVYWKPAYNPRSWPGAGYIGGRVRRHVG